jgi:hypothetical protein
MFAASFFLTAPIDVFTSETVSIVGPIGTIIALIVGIYWALAREKLVTGAAHRRELAVRDRDIERERIEHDQYIAIMREDHRKRIDDIRSDAVASAIRREAENAATIAGLRADVTRLYGAWQITESAAERVVTSRIRADDETIITLMEAIRRSQTREPPELPPADDRIE